MESLLPAYLPPSRPGHPLSKCVLTFQDKYHFIWNVHIPSSHSDTEKAWNAYSGNTNAALSWQLWEWMESSILFGTFASSLVCCHLGEQSYRFLFSTVFGMHKHFISGIKPKLLNTAIPHRNYPFISRASHLTEVLVIQKLKHFFFPRKLI